MDSLRLDPPMMVSLPDDGKCEKADRETDKSVVAETVNSRAHVG